jgi:5-methylcytosine-specific restriction endonuclease McrA
VHLQRAFLLNKGSYTCFYCRRTAWGVYAEESGEATRRTLRFEVDHRRTRRRLPDASRFDAENLVAACRSCNVIKGEMLEQRFLRELKSLSRAVQEWR